MKKKEYQTGTATATQIENGLLSNVLIEKSKNGWTLKTIERYFSKQNEEDSFFWVLERDYAEEKIAANRVDGLASCN